MTNLGWLIVCVLAVVGCGDDGPTDVNFGETTLVVAVNPEVNDLNEASVPTPGTTKAVVRVELDTSDADTTGADGVAVIAPVDAGNRTITLSGTRVSGTVMTSIAEKDLREVAIATDGNGASSMADTLFAFGGAVLDVTPEMTLTEVNDALSNSNTIVFFAGGTYTGDLQFSGSNVTLFGEGNEGGRVTITGDVTIPGSGIRVRGASITGNLIIPGSDVSVSFSRVEGNVTIDGSDPTLLLNEVCGTTTIAGSGAIALGNQGMAPLSAPTDCP